MQDDDDDDDDYNIMALSQAARWRNTVFTTTPQVNGECQISTPPPYRIETFESIAKIDTVNYLRAPTPHAKFGDNPNPFMENFWGNG